MIGHIFLSLISVAEILSILMQDSEAAAAFKDGMISISSFFIKTCVCAFICTVCILHSFLLIGNRISLVVEKGSEDELSFKPKGG